MRIIVISDTHGNFKTLWDIVDKHQNDAQTIVFLGDGLRELEDVITLYPKLDFKYVAGNCDYASTAKRTDAFWAEGKKILFTHGDSYGVKYSVDRLISTARENHADIALFGHTHCGVTEYHDGLYLMNPGSPSCPRNAKSSYGIIDNAPAGIALNLVMLP